VGNDIPHDWPSWRTKLRTSAPIRCGGRERHLIGCLIGTESAWRRRAAELLRRVGTVTEGWGRRTPFDVERVTIEQSTLRQAASDIVIDRLA